MDVRDSVIQFVIEARVHLRQTDCGCDSEISCAPFDDDGVNGRHAVMNVAFLRLSPHVRPANCLVAKCSMAMRLDCTRPMCTFQPSIEIVVHWRTIASSSKHEYCSMMTECYSWKLATEFGHWMNAVTMVAFDCYRLEKLSHSLMLVMLLHEQLSSSPVDEVCSNFAILWEKKHMLIELKIKFIQNCNQ